MQIEILAKGRFRLVMTKDELAAIGNCLNEVSGGFHVADFVQRIGCEVGEVETLLISILKAYHGSSESWPDYPTRMM